ncbi:hypothetical protein E5K00_14670 [Hymenobacter aquaticus]|uniref:Alpha/beta hydrolase n=1 Tax=Hymenobacter aquaticus TaxID=1867101 RepID=A0A4Z0PW78_9BACT|nr:hypothetical protein [Hymenobacter aquaticus]TGE21526.1 hypothetical protein E5K00_14670 [Hymenobacter aquaticus]
MNTKFIFNIILWVMIIANAAFMCSCTMRYVLYGTEASRYSGAVQNDSTFVYFDRQGDMYPSVDSRVVVHDDRLNYHGASLQHYFQFLTKPIWSADQQAQVTSLSRYYGVNLDLPAKETEVKASWLQLQDSVQTKFIRNFNRQLKASKTDVLVVLIHGYNNNVGETRWFAPLKRQILANYFIGERVHFLHIYWDGRSGTFVLPMWTWAQGSLYPVGLGVRQILTRLDPKMPVYALGHSTGAPVLCAALWNCTSALNKGRDYQVHLGERYLDMLKQPRYITPTLPKLRVAFVAPAMPALHFNDFDNRTTIAGQQSLTPPPLTPQRFVIGHNRHDKVTGKGPFPTRLYGSTRLGTKRSEYCGHGNTTPYGVLTLLRSTGSSAETFLYDFTKGIPWFGLGHGVVSFMNDERTFSQFLDAWLTNKPVRGNTTCP